MPAPPRPSFSRRAVIGRALLGLTAVVTLSAASGQMSRLNKLAFKIAAGAAPEALAEFVRQSGFQVLFDFDAVRNFSTREVTGQLDPGEALARMFEGSGLTFEFINDRTIAVHASALEKKPSIAGRLRGDLSEPPGD